MPAPHVLRAITPTFLVLCCASTLAQGYFPEEAARRMTVAEGFRVELVVSEPLVRQPVAIDFDDRGRLWVIQYLQYPNPAGLARVKVDRYSRTTYDQVPQPPPHGPRGADRITILEDTNSDGRMDRSKDFINGLNLTTGFAFGYGGVFVLNVPYLLFYPDRNRDDVPDGDPEVLLQGFGMEDSSSLANSLTFGPDGWLYGTQGTNIMADIRGIKFEQGVWRYHPVTRKFELFAEGGGNSWGLDFDRAGRLFFSTNHGGYIFDYALQGAYYHKAFEKHGALHNPYAFGYLEPVPHRNFQGGHVTVGGSVYQSDAFPPQFRGTYIGADLLGHAVYWHSIQNDGSTVRTAHGGTLLQANDTWFAPSDLTIGPDGAVYIADWHDQRTAHPDPDATWDRTNGRIYRLQSVDGGGKPPVTKPIDPNSQSSKDLLGWLSRSDTWSVRCARRILAERRDPTVIPKLKELTRQAGNDQLALDALLTLAAMGAFDEKLARQTLLHHDPAVRAWSVRLLGDGGKISSETRDQLASMASSDPNPMVRAQLASSAKRLPADAAVAIVERLLTRQEDQRDRTIPLLLWWAIEAHAIDGRDRILAAFATPAAWENEYTREAILGRLVRRYAAAGNDFEACAQLLNSAPTAALKLQLVSELDTGLELIGHERPPGLPPGSLLTKFAVDGANNPATTAGRFPTIPQPLAEPLTRLWDDNTVNSRLISVMLRFGSDQAERRAISLATDPTRPESIRRVTLGVLGEQGGPASTAPILSLIEAGQPEQLRRAALFALAARTSDKIPEGILRAYPAMNDGLRSAARNVMFARREWALLFLESVAAKQVAAQDVTLDELRRIALHQDPRLDELVRTQWGGVRSGTPDEKLAEVRRLTNDLRAGTGAADRGREHFKKICATCHQFHGEGTNIGPDLTQANRRDRDFLLVSLVDPSVQIRKEFLSYVVVTTDGRVSTGVLASETPAAVTLVDAKNQRTTIARADIADMKPSDVSLMPDNILKDLSPQDLRDLFAYLER